MTSYESIKNVATGMYARRICGDAVDKVLPRPDYDGDFNFDFINDCDVPGPKSGGNIREHEVMWDRFFADLTAQWIVYVNNRK